MCKSNIKGVSVRVAVSLAAVFSFVGSNVGWCSGEPVVSVDRETEYHAGKVVTVVGENFLPSETLKIAFVLVDGSFEEQQVTTTIEGQLHTTYTLPPDPPLGDHRIEAYRAGGGYNHTSKQSPTVQAFLRLCNSFYQESISCLRVRG